jgi:hypothetical protein
VDEDVAALLEEVERFSDDERRRFGLALGLIKRILERIHGHRLKATGLGFTAGPAEPQRRRV